MYYECEKCKKRFISEELVNIHIEWAHDIPLYDLSEGIERLKKEMTALDEYFWN